MREQRKHREVFERVVRRTMGVDQRAERRSALAVRYQGGEASHLALPEETDTLVETQMSDGTFLFLIDGSLIDGPDPL